eukprot:jgi/Hompol1/748/HPOL_005401-RA
MDELILKVQLKSKLPQPIQKLLYTMEDGDTVVVTDIQDLREGQLYYALTVNEQLPKKPVPTFSPKMEAFLGKLEASLKIEAKKKQQMADIRAALYKEDIDFDRLMATGDLAITDAKLEKCGIKTDGLRFAILSAIKDTLRSSSGPSRGIV